MLPSKPNKSRNETKCDFQKEPCVDKNTCHNMLCHVECEDDCIFSASFYNERIEKEQVKNVILFNDKDKRLGLK